MSSRNGSSSSSSSASSPPAPPSSTRRRPSIRFRDLATYALGFVSAALVRSTFLRGIAPDCVSYDRVYALVGLGSETTSPVSAEAEGGGAPEATERRRFERVPLEDLAGSYRPYACPSGLEAVRDTILPRSITHSGRLIPRVVHVTSKSRCMTPEFVRNIDRWRFANHSLYVHDDDAVHRLLLMDFATEFPDLREVRKCLTVGAVLSDVWRYVLMYEYGGIYTDFDNSPQLFDGTTIYPTDDSFFVLEKLGIMAQYFLASSPGHPLWLNVTNDALSHVRLRTENVMALPYAAKMTGPGALKRGFIYFMAGANYSINGYIPAGLYVGPDNRSCTVLGDKRKSTEYVHRGGVRDKEKLYWKMGMSHFLSTRDMMPTMSCEEHIRRTNGTDLVANYPRVKKHHPRVKKHK